MTVRRLAAFAWALAFGALLSTGCGARNLGVAPLGDGAAGLGAGGADGGASCGPCPAAACASGDMSWVEPSVSCCPFCRPSACGDVACDSPSCPVGSHPEALAGSCCRTCVLGPAPPPSPACDAAKRAYEATRSTLLQNFVSTPCKVDADCAVVLESNPCAYTCGLPLPAAGAPSFERGLAGVTEACQASCPTEGFFPCRPSQPSCLEATGLCVLVGTSE